MKTYAEQIAAFQADRAAKAAQQKALMDAAVEKGETLDAAGQEEFDTLQSEIVAIDAHLKRLEQVEKSTGDGGELRQANGGGSDEGAASRNAGGEARILVRSQPQLEKGIAFARLVKSFGIAKGSMEGAIGYARARYGDQSDTVGILKLMVDRGIDKIEKAEVPAGANISGNWADNLVGAETSAFADFVEYLRPMTILGRFGTGNIPGLRRVPFRVPLITQTAPGEGYWVGEGKPKPLTSFGFGRTTLDPLKVANIAVLTKEMVRDSSPSAEAIVRDQLAEALAARLDIDFVNPSKTASAGVSPASITNGADSIAASGTGDADDIRLDARSLMQKFVDANNPLSSGVWIMSAGSALALSMLVNALGQPEFKDITPTGGTFFGLPVIVSEYVGDNYLSGNIIVLVNARDIYFSDEGGVSVDMSTEASLEMLDSSLQQSAVADVNATSLVSMFQTNSIAFLAERTVNWARRRSTAVTYLTGAAWGGAVNT